MEGHPKTHPEPFHNATNILKRHSKVCILLYCYGQRVRSDNLKLFGRCKLN